MSFRHSNRDDGFQHSLHQHRLCPWIPFSIATPWPPNLIQVTQKKGITHVYLSFFLTVKHQGSSRTKQAWPPLIPKDHSTNRSLPYKPQALIKKHSFIHFIKHRKRNKIKLSKRGACVIRERYKDKEGIDNLIRYITKKKKKKRDSECEVQNKRKSSTSARSWCCGEGEGGGDWRMGSEEEDMSAKSAKISSSSMIPPRSSLSAVWLLMLLWWEGREPKRAKEDKEGVVSSKEESDVAGEMAGWTVVVLVGCFLI